MTECDNRRTVDRYYNWTKCTVKMGALGEPALLLLFWQSVWALDIPLEIRQPPTIVKQSMKEHIVDPKDTMVIECEAKGNPHPIFSWRRNGKYFNVARDSQTSMRRRSGTLDIYARNNPEQYEAEYQCIASNEYGSAYSNKIRLKLYRAPVWPREILEPVVISAGLPLVLSCDPPPGPPKPETYWMSSCSYARPFNWPIQTAFPTMQPVRQDRRVSMGVNGDLYFSNVQVNDSVSDYCCNARFPYKNVIQQKLPVVVKVLTTRTVAEAAPTWLSPTGSSSSILVLQGEELLLECIAGGVPTPHITWTKDGEDLVVTPRMKVKNFNKMIKIPKASFEDVGEYTCSATNKIGYIEHTITVKVKAAPFWIEKPTDLILAPEENGRLVCRSDGVPRPTVSWFINGEPIETATPQPNRQVSGETLSFRSVTAENNAVYQCNASNQYGYLLANAFVNVLHATPRILGPRNELIKAIEGSRVFLDCRYFGSPVPELRWSKYGQGNLEGTRFKTHSNGTLEIRRIRIEDQGTYLCIVSNIAGREENQVRIEVKEPTLIVTRPQSMKSSRQSDHNYDVASRPADRPNPPTDLQLSDPYERSVRLSWVPGDSNHSPITEFLVQYDDDDWLPGKWRNLSTYPGNLNSVVLHLTPFTYYEFRVIAFNEIGPSRPSRPSKRFQTSGAPPDVIPKNVKGVGTWRNNMEISWEPLTYREWNGPHLKYLVWWRRRDSREEWKNATTKWLKYYIYDADTFTPYDIKVQAVNEFGLGPESPVVTGYSGEDRPLAAPLNLRVSDIESTQATVHWDSVTRESLMGELKEYKIYYWRDSSQLRWHRVNRGMKSQVFPNNDPEPSGVLTGLIPYSNYKMYVVVANNRFEGPPSNTIPFSTPEGLPSAPRSFRIQQRHLDSIYVDWDLPAEPNGIITGYSLKYQTVNATRGEELRVEEFPPNVTSFSVRRYDRYTRYRFSIAARTQIGIGEWHTEESPHYTTETYAQDQVDITTQGWFIGIMCAVALIVLILLIVCFIKRSRGGKYPVREKKDISLEPVDDKDQEGSFDYRSLERIARVSTLPFPRREEEKGLQRGQPSIEAMMKRSDSDDSLVEYGEGGEIQFNEDGSFIGQYTGTRRDVRELDFGGGLELHSPMNTIYSLA
ncbi:neuronal cell adhesion molecule-like [Mugil cephalus]|uniref:neuronal cell adhesion molecule-like n=1 Tax=Mugil cephalus TaxID=48193 RepID=UPI001FB8254E|nr:neuronal cell adhesion molecule-like [Mugil cephalus]